MSESVTNDRRPVPQARARPRSTPRCAGSAPTTSTSTRSTGGTRDADRGDDGGARRRRARRQGPLPRRLEHVRLAVRARPRNGAERPAGRRSCRCRTTTTSPTARRSGRCCRSACDRGRRAAVQPARPRAAHRQPQPRGERPRPSAAGQRPAGRRDVRRGRLRRGRRAASRSPATRGLPPAQVALAWLPGRPGVTAPIVGATKLGHVDDAIASVDRDARTRTRSPGSRRRTGRIRCSATSDRRIGGSGGRSGGRRRRRSPARCRPGRARSAPGPARAGR